jgi:hypothetical protein
MRYREVWASVYVFVRFNYKLMVALDVCSEIVNQSSLPLQVCIKNCLRLP